MEVDKKRKREIKNLLPIVRIARKWAEIKAGDLSNRAQLIEKFDEGYYTISIVNEEGYFQRLIRQYQFKEDFPKPNIHTTNDLYVEYEENEETLKYKLATVFHDTKAKEIPILHKGKIRALGRLSDYYDMDGNWDSMRVYNFRWEWINKGVAKEFFGKRRNVLISSEHGLLKGFREAFSSWLNITVYEDAVLEQCLKGKFDMMIQGSDFFQAFPMEKWWVHRLYFVLLVETVRRWLNRRGVAIHFFSCHQDVPGIENRIDLEYELIGGGKEFLREGENPYFIMDGSDYDAVLEEENLQPNYHGGRRCVTEASTLTSQGIYFFGPCTVVGVSTYSPDKTIESVLQLRLNKEKLKYQVINCGTDAIPDVVPCFNWLFRLIDTPLSSGDVVVIFERHFALWEIDKQLRLSNYHSMLPVFVSEENVEKKCFIDTWPAHLNVTGYRIAADYIFRVISHDLHNSRISNIRKRFLSRYSLRFQKGARLEEWLGKISLYKTKKEAGAIVIKGDPLTIGHLLFVQRALEECDSLYIFLIEGENSLLCTKKRKIIFYECFKETRIVVLSLGRCMRDAMRYNIPLKRFISISPEAFDPVEDTYIFARYIAPMLGIRRRFFGAEPFDAIKRRYNILKREILEEEGLEYIEIPRMKLEDGRDVITAEVRKIWREKGWKACRDYLPEVVCKILEGEETSHE